MPKFRVHYENGTSKELEASLPDDIRDGRWYINPCDTRASQCGNIRKDAPAFVPEPVVKAKAVTVRREPEPEPVNHASELRAKAQRAIQPEPTAVRRG